MSDKICDISEDVSEKLKAFKFSKKTENCALIRKYLKNSIK